MRSDAVCNCDKGIQGWRTSVLNSTAFAIRSANGRSWISLSMGSLYIVCCRYCGQTSYLRRAVITLLQRWLNGATQDMGGAAAPCLANRAAERLTERLTAPPFAPLPVLLHLVALQLRRLLDQPAELGVPTHPAHPVHRAAWRLLTSQQPGLAIPLKLVCTRRTPRVVVGHFNPMLWIMSGRRFKQSIRI